MRTRLALTPVLLSIAACSASPYSESIGKLGEKLATMTESYTEIRSGAERDRGRWDVMRTSIGRTRTEPFPNCSTDECYFRIVPPSPVAIPAPGGAPALAAALRNPPAPIAAPASATPAADAPPDVCLTAADGRMTALQGVTGEQVRDAVAAGRNTPAAAPVRLSEREIYRALREYGDALKAISNAKDREDFNKAADGLAETAGTIAGTVGTAAGGAPGAAIGPVASAAVKLAAFARAQALERRRYETLRASLIQTCIPIRTLVRATGLLSAAHRTERLGWNLDTMTLARVQVDRGNADRVTALRLGQEAAASRNTLRVDPRIAAREFIAAHDALVKAVTSQEDQTDAVLESLTTFAKRVDDLRRATADLD